MCLLLSTYFPHSHVLLLLLCVCVCARACACVCRIRVAHWYECRLSLERVRLTGSTVTLRCAKMIQTGPTKKQRFRAFVYICPSSRPRVDTLSEQTAPTWGPYKSVSGRKTSDSWDGHRGGGEGRRPVTGAGSRRDHRGCVQQTNWAVLRYNRGWGDEFLPGKLPVDVCRGDPNDAPLLQVHMTEARGGGQEQAAHAHDQLWFIQDAIC